MRTRKILSSSNFIVGYLRINDTLEIYLIGGSQFIEMGASYLISVATVAVTVVNMII